MGEIKQRSRKRTNRSERQNRDRRDTNAKEISAILSSFHKLRILHRIGLRPVSSLSLLEELQWRHSPRDLATLNRFLSSMVRQDWLASKKPSAGTPADYSLTAKGRLKLKAAHAHLKILGAALHDPSRPQGRGLK